MLPNIITSSKSKSKSKIKSKSSSLNILFLLINSFFSSQSAKHHNSKTNRARDLTFWHNFHHFQCDTWHMSHVTCHMSGIRCHIFGVICQVSPQSSKLCLTPPLPFLAYPFFFKLFIPRPPHFLFVRSDKI